MTYCRFTSVLLTSLPNILKVVYVEADVGASPVNIVGIRCNRSDFNVELYGLDSVYCGGGGGA